MDILVRLEMKRFDETVPFIVDSHGSINIFDEEGWSNVKLEANRVVGSNLNCYLKAMFILFGVFPLHDHFLPGGISCWEETYHESIACLSSFCPVVDILVRMEMLSMIYNKNCNTSDAAVLELEQMTTGSLTFLYYWIKCYHITITEQDLLSIGSSVHRMKRCFQYHDNCTKNPYQSLIRSKQLVFSILQSRCKEYLSSSWLKAGLQYGYKGEFDFQYFIDIENEKIRKENEKEMKEQQAREIKQQIKEQLKENLASAGPTFKLEIFGADNLFGDSSDDDDDDDDEDNSNSDKNTAVNIDDQNISEANGKIDDDKWKIFYRSTSKGQHQYIPRIKLHNSMLVDPWWLSQRLLDEIDTLEIAKQWTLVDEELFHTSSLHQLLIENVNCFPSSYSASNRNKATVERLSYLFSNQLGGFRRLIDRFNASSLFLAAAILRKTTSEERARTITKIIRLAQHLQEDCHNYHALMSVITALQQGCISRLSISWSLVEEDVLNTYKELKSLMAGERNYFRYRERLASDMERLEKERNLSLFTEWKEFLKKRKTVKHGVLSKVVDKTIDTKPKEETESSVETIEGKIMAIIPHFGAHIGTLTAISECHNDFLSDYPHLFNFHKIKLCSSVVNPLLILQSVRHNAYVPVRMIAAALHCAWKPFHHRYQDHRRLDGASIDIPKKLFQLSEVRESRTAIQLYFEEKQRREQMLLEQKNIKPPDLILNTNGEGDQEPVNSRKPAMLRVSSEASSASMMSPLTTARSNKSMLSPGKLVRFFSTASMIHSHAKKNSATANAKDDNEENADSAENEIPSPTISRNRSQSMQSSGSNPTSKLKQIKEDKEESEEEESVSRKRTISQEKTDAKNTSSKSSSTNEKPKLEKKPSTFKKVSSMFKSNKPTSSMINML